MYAIEQAAQAAEQQHTLKQRFRMMVWRGRWHRVWSWLRGEPSELLDVTALLDGHSIRNVRSMGYQTVAINQIHGSEGRTHDFDAAFYPLQTRTEERWLGVARARSLGAELPPVDLVEVGGTYVVRDGHHRISVAAALGQREIDAVVTIWELDEPQELTTAEEQVCQPAKSIPCWSGACHAGTVGHACS
jgi:hypothetical protein